MKHNPKYDARIVLLPNVERLLPGDILLSRNTESTGRTGSKVAAVITAATKGRFSHALICSKPPTLIEAIGHGVSTLSLARCYAHSFDNVRVLRYPDAAIARKAAELVQIEVGRDYSMLRAFQSVLSSKTLEKTDDHGVFCSALIAQVYVAAGAEPFKRTAVEKTTPATLERLDELVDVTGEIFQEAVAPKNIETMTALDGDAAYTPSARQTEISNRYAKATLPLANRISEEYFCKRLKVTPTYYGVIQFVVDAFGALPNINVTLRADAFGAITELDEALCKLIESGEFAALISEMEQIEGAELQRAVQVSFDPEPDIDARALAGMLQTTSSQLEERRRAARTLDQWSDRSRSVSGYLSIESKAIEALERREVLCREILGRIRLNTGY